MNLNPILNSVYFLFCSISPFFFLCFLFFFLFVFVFSIFFFVSLRSRIKSGRHDVPVMFMAFPVVYLFLLHDFQTQRATVIEVSRAPGAMWLPWGRLDWNFGRLVWGEVLVQDGKSSHSLCRRRRRGSNKVRKIKLMDCRSFITSAEFFCGQWLSYKIAFFCFGTLQSLNSSNILWRIFWGP